MTATPTERGTRGVSGPQPVRLPYSPNRPMDPFSLPRSAYIHVPFCVHRCGYCDFTVVAGRDDLIGEFLTALEIELSWLQQPRPVDTLFIGGGTPTYLPPAELERLLKCVNHWFPLTSGGEFSVEANPVGLSDDKLVLLAERGVNRVSLGVQSFHAETLKVLERDHSPEMARERVAAVRERFPECAVDLIFGVPGQTLEVWRETLDQAAALGPTHLSTYGLTFEKGTAFWGRRLKGELDQVAESDERAQYELAMERLESLGYGQYELSNHARPGHESRHNAVYWAGGPYYAAGPGAARYIDGVRETNHRSTTTWIRGIRSDCPAFSMSETLSPEDRARETLMLGLRRTAGVFRQAFHIQTGFDLDLLAGPTIDRAVAHGLLDDDGQRIALTRSGRCVADSIMAEML